jgi:hypothetical protein
MADLTTSLIVLATVYDREITRQLDRTAKTFSILPKRTANAAKANYGIDTGGITAATYAEGANVGTATSDSQTALSLSLANYEAPFALTDKVMAAAAVNGVTGNIDQFARQMIGAASACAKQINGDLFDGTAVGSTEAMIGLETWIDNSNTVGGIDRSSATYWQSYVATDAVTLTKKILYTDLAEISNLGGLRPNLAICNPLVFAQIEALYDSNIQYIADFSSITGSPVLGGGAVPTIIVNGCAFIEDADGYVDTTNNDGTIYYLNTDHIWIEVLPERMQVPGFDTLQVPAMQGATQMTSFDAGFAYKAVGRTAHAKKAVVSNMLQLCIDKPNAFGKRSNISLALS